MNKWARAFSLVLLLAFCVAAGYGWGNATHVYFAKHLGVKFGPVNMNEIYGAVLPDMFNLQFTDPEAQQLTVAFHTNEAFLAALYGSSPSRNSKAAYWGAFTHNNVWGADRTAHGEYPGSEEGWIIQRGMELAPAIAADLVALNPDLGSFSGLNELVVGMGHDISETAVDILVKRDLDPLVGPRLYASAKFRSPEVPLVLAGVLAAMGADRQVILEGEKQYREGMMQYGQLFALPESELIPMIAAFSADVAEEYIEAVTGSYGEPITMTIPPELVAKHLLLALDLVKARGYEKELARTMAFVQKGLEDHGIVPASAVLAFAGNGSIEEELGTEAVSGVEPLPTEYRLEQNYPNPFNPSTAIRFALPADGNVTVKVYNTIGQEVATLFDAYTPAGRHEITWDAKNLPSGVYIYRLVAGRAVETKKMTLMK